MDCSSDMRPSLLRSGEGGQSNVASEGTQRIRPIPPQSRGASRCATGPVRIGRALLLSGGIGDYLHYLCRLTSYLAQSPVPPSELIICIESTVPTQVVRLFSLAFPDLRFEFVPPALHWTKTNPLLEPTNEVDRKHRPAYRYVQQWCCEITDWFLPFCCDRYEFDSSPLVHVVGARPAGPNPTVVLSMRDKGFLWWPTVELLDEVRKAFAGWRTVYYGTPDERLPGLDQMVTAGDVAEALAASYWADLFIGTDTGLATVRELTGRKLIYCISEYWLTALMTRYQYLDPKRTQSVFAFEPGQLLSLVEQHLSPSRGVQARIPVKPAPV